ncbi:MAG: hypothetical protein ABIN89_23110 [Chitinophagaceae bacterium]
MKRFKRTLTVAAIIIIMLFIFSNCIQENKSGNDARGNDYAGSAKCGSCHRAIYNSYKNTAHYVSTGQASSETIKGSFHPDSNVYSYRPTLKVTMVKRDSGLYQVASIDGIDKQAQRFDIVFGSGRKGQSYAYWFGDHIFQLPVSYYVPAKTWVNSPNYPPHNVKFNRNVLIGCFECHASFIEKTSEEVANNELVDHFSRENIIYGIDCERCHGAAAKHVVFHEANPQEKKGMYLPASNKLSREEKLTMCSLCHSGPGKTKKSPFYYNPGDKLTDYLYADNSPVTNADIEVHGKQFQLLSASQCFIKSRELNCSSCHNPHVQERDKPALFSQKCMNCHSLANHNFCKIAPEIGSSIVNNCIDCHMPAKPSNVITVMSQSKATNIPALVRTHLIAVYPDEKIRR